MCRPPTVKLAQNIRILGQFGTCLVLNLAQFRPQIENKGHFRTHLRTSNFEMDGFFIKANSFPILIYEDLSLKAADVIPQ